LIVLFIFTKGRTLYYLYQLFLPRGNGAK